MSTNPRNKLLIAQDNLSASQLQEELQFFLNPQKTTQELLFFPDWETLPYDQFSPHQDIISERLYTLSRIQQVTNAMIITSASTLMHRLCPPEFLNQYALMLKEGQKLDLTLLEINCNNQDIIASIKFWNMVNLLYVDPLLMCILWEVDCPFVLSYLMMK